MKYWALTPIVAAILLIPNSDPASIQQQPAPPAQQDLTASKAAAEQAIKHLIVSQVEAWNRGDLEGFMSGYWRSPDLTFRRHANKRMGAHTRALSRTLSEPGEGDGEAAISGSEH